MILDDPQAPDSYDIYKKIANTQKINFQKLSKPYTINLTHNINLDQFIHITQGKIHSHSHMSLIQLILILYVHKGTCTYLSFSNMVCNLNVPDSDTHFIYSFFSQIAR
ncbi:Type IV secretion system virB10 [Gossypium arboreum]|uniref:Type IV secretion system virB10 n=1 Tax=Gossypium arboreum TaxID=29729 RepID=A0A0B0MHA1_GOSAR|nr:Type IV secretion system virB10 [Gossypium arboreum]